MGFLHCLREHNVLEKRKTKVCVPKKAELKDYLGRSSTSSIHGCRRTPRERTDLSATFGAQIAQASVAAAIGRKREIDAAAKMLVRTEKIVFSDAKRLLQHYRHV
jgi:hypothetical protein